MRKTGFTFAPEAGTQRLRDVIQKEYPRRSCSTRRACSPTSAGGRLKLYFMIGLPSETDEDVLGIAELAGRVKRAAGGRLARHRERLDVLARSRTRRSSGPRSSTSRRPRRASRCCAASSAAAASSSAGTTASSRGSRASSRAATGASPTSSSARSAPAPASTAGPTTAASTLWRDGARRAADSTPAFYLRRRPLGEALPWDHLDAGVSTRFLQPGPGARGRGAADARLLDRALHLLRRVRLPDGAQRRLPPRGRQGQRAPRRARSRAGRSCSCRRRTATPLPEWETRTWRRIRTEVAARRAARVPARAAPAHRRRRAAARRARRDGRRSPRPRAARATPRSGSARSRRRSRRRPPAPVAVQRSALRYRKVGAARFIGTRELSTVFARAARRARLPRRLLPRPPSAAAAVVRPGACRVGASSEDELLDIDLTRARCPPRGARPPRRPSCPTGSSCSAPSRSRARARSIDAVGGRRSAGTSTCAMLPAPPAPDAVARRGRALPRRRRRSPCARRGKRGERLVDARALGHRARASLARSGSSSRSPSGRRERCGPSAIVAALLDLDADGGADARASTRSPPDSTPRPSRSRLRGVP